MNCCSECSVGPGLLEEVVDVVGFKSVVVVNAVVAEAVDPGDAVVDSTVFKRCGVVDEDISTTRC